MIKKIIYPVIFLLGVNQVGFVQLLKISEKYHFLFETFVDIEIFDNEADCLIGYENNNLALDTELFYPNKVTSNYFTNLTKTTEVIASQLSFYEVKTMVDKAKTDEGGFKINTLVLRNNYAITYSIPFVCNYT